MMVERARGWLERFILNPAAITPILMALMAQAGVTLYYQVTNNERQEAKLEANATAIASLRSEIVNLQTPLSTIVLKLEGRVSGLEAEHKNLEQRMTSTDSATAARVEAIDRGGTRAMDIVSDNVKRMTAQVDRLGERTIMLDKKISEIESRNLTQIQGQIDAFKMVIQRIEEQQSRIIQALDAQYNTLTEYIRANPKPPIPRPRQ